MGLRDPLSFTRLRMFNVPETAFQVNVAQELGLADPPTDPFSFGLPFFNVANYSLVTDSPSAPQTQRDNLWHFSTEFSNSLGRHTWKAGFELLLLRPELPAKQSRPAGNTTTPASSRSVDGSGVGSGNPFARFSARVPAAEQRTKGSGQAILAAARVPATYVQDELADRTPRLTAQSRSAL